MVTIGIDLGAKQAGTTVICALSGNRCSVTRSVLGQDADAFLRRTIEEAHPELVGIDAPLSLPGVYRGIEGYTDYFYRRADRTLRAMSPMFLGGLTARAIALKDRLVTKGIRVVEVYPAGLIRATSDIYSEYQRLKKAPKGKAPHDFLLRLAEQYNAPPPPAISTGHELDAYLALITCVRVARGEAQAVGSAEEGLVML